jgi:hypothetical protein
MLEIQKNRVAAVRVSVRCAPVWVGSVRVRVDIGVGVCVCVFLCVRACVCALE